MDPLENTSVPHLKVGEWKVEDVVKQGEDKIEFEKVLGYHQHNCAGLGSMKQTEVPPKQTHDYRNWCPTKFMIWKKSDISQNLCSYAFKATRWCNYIQNELSWKHLLVTSSRLTSFVLGATFDTLPFPTNLKRWHITAERTAHCVLLRFVTPLMFSLAVNLLSVRVDILSVTI